MAALEAVRARLGRNMPTPDGVLTGRQLVASVLQRADEPGEALGYWTGRYGRSIPKPIKRGSADAVRRLYTERSLLTYDTALHGFRFADVVELTHPSPDPVTPWQGDLFRYALDRRHNRAKSVPGSLRTVIARKRLMRLPVAERRALL